MKMESMKVYRELMKRWYPSMKRMTCKFFVAISLYTILYFAYITYISGLFNWLGTNIETQNMIIIFLSKFSNSFLLPLMVAILLFYLGIIEIQRMEYSAALNELIFEMNYNCSEILKFPKNVEDKTGWVSKNVSYTNWADGNNFYYKYLPTNAYFNFVNKGYILDKIHFKIPSGNIAKFYDVCVKFNIHIQMIENQDPKPIDPLRTFIKSKLYQEYLYGNDLNEGVIGEYKMILKSLEKYKDINKGLIGEYKMILKSLENQ